MLSLSACVLLAACDQANPVTAVPAPPVPHALIATPAVADPVMGRFSSLARHVVIALRDSSVRHELADSLRASSGHGMIDLSACGRESLSHRLFDRGEFFGAGSASAICAVATRGATTLYIDRMLLANWDPQTIPLVTAVEQPSSRPDSVLAYRSPDRMIRIPAHDLAKIGPVLVIVPLIHPGAARSTPQSVHVTGAALSTLRGTR